MLGALKRAVEEAKERDGAGHRDKGCEGSEWEEDDEEGERMEEEEERAEEEEEEEGDRA